MPLADAHIHLFRDGFPGPGGKPPTGGDDLGAYEALRGLHDIDLALVVGYEGQPAHTGNNNYIAGLARQLSWIAPVAYLPTRPPPGHEALDRLTDKGFRGVTLMVTTREAAADVAGWPTQIVRHISRFEVVSLNAAADVTAQLSPFVRALAPATVLFSHLGLPGRHREPPAAAAARERLAPLLALSAEPHVGVKLSGLYATSDPRHDYPHRQSAPYIENVLDRFGVDRLYWGSDFSPCLNWVSFRQAVDVRLPVTLSPSEAGRLMGGNLRRILGITPSHR